MGLPKGTLVGPYEVVSLVGAGGMGEVYRARDERIGRDVAVKVLPPEFAAEPERLRRFEQEARTAGALNHPNILSVHDVGSFQGSPYMVTELLEGETLSQRMHGVGLTTRRAVEVAIQIARGLAAAHEKGIIHRDLKPTNVFITNDGQVKILDFGLAKVARPETAPDPYGKTATSASLTKVGAVLGTMGYMAPEQLRGEPADARSDIFALGCVLYEMLLGQPPFLRKTGPDTVSAVLLEEPPGLDGSSPNLPAVLCQIVQRCLEKRPQERFATAHDLALALEAASSSDAAIAVPGIRRRWPPARRWTAAAGLFAAMAAIAALWILRTRSSDELPQFQPHRVVGQLAVLSEPALSPSGTEIAYTGSQHGTSAVWVTDVRGGKPIRLTEESALSFSPTWFPDGSTIAFSSARGTETSVWKVARFGGTPMLLVPDAMDPAISPDGKHIAFARAGSDTYLRIWVAPLGAPDQAQRLTTGDTGVWSHRRPAWSPDGRTIFFQDKRNLWLVPSGGGPARPLTAGDPVNANPVWSSNGRHIFFTSNRDGTESLWRQPVDGGAAVRVTHGAGPERWPSISRDGRRLAFTTGLETTWIALVDTQGGQVATVHGSRTAEFPTIAPDRSALVFESDLAGSSDLWAVPLRGNAPAGEPTRLTESQGSCAVPAYSPDGRWIAYLRVVEGQRDIWVVPALGGAPVNLTRHPAVDMEPAWSPDGREIAFVSNRDGWHEIWAAPFSNGQRVGEARRITDDNGNASYPSWSPDGREIAYVLATNTGNDVRITPAKGGGPSRAVTSAAQAFMIRWWWQRNLLAVSGYFGAVSPTIRLFTPRGETAGQLAIPPPTALAPEYPDFDLSGDGSLLALFQTSRQDEIWVLEVEKGTF